ncbi:nitrilase-related carbon-nitrogen hydrolase [Rubritalea marina]|uniref:nitrilase-related carbon-nitrogen hydrolase n=1 Tax=Rubritalea marina TaxID=361055 RepID=UPI00037761F8|nr:nitrilase-related carbon-nitrogen hydrolase [Rubritalea marina]
MKILRVAAASVNQTPMDWRGNAARLIEVIESAKAEGVQVLTLPELAITGYGCEDAFLMPNTVERAESVLAEILPHTSDMMVCVGMPWRHRHALFSVAAIAVDGALVALSAKQHLAGDGLHYEPRWFSAWPAGEQAEVRCCGCSVPMGDVVVDLEGLKVGFEICEDAWSATRPVNALSRYGVDVICNPSASHFAFNKQRLRERFINEGARCAGAAYLYANLLGNESGRVIFDGGPLISNAGSIVGRGDRFSFQHSTLVQADVDVDVNRAKLAATASRVVEVRDCLRTVVVDWAPTYLQKAASIEHAGEAWEKEEEFAHAVGLGLFDYLRKSYSQGFVVSLSGGADSSAVASLVAIAMQLALDELGEAGVRQRLSHIELADASGEWMKQLLACVYQASEHSGDATEESARELARALGADFHRWSIASLVDDYTDKLQAVLGRELDWDHDDLALQNIQARVRSPGIWMMANVRRALLLSTSNRSEAAVGYATMDGDTSGGLSPVAGIDKAFLRQWLVWLERVGSKRIAKVGALHFVNGLQPTAELRPASESQTDEGDLMPYPVLDAIERAAIRDKQAPLEVYLGLKDSLSKYPAGQLKSWVIKFFRLWCVNQWKRERYAPSFHVDDENLDPKTWCRFPILSSGFKAELIELEKFES